jgi:hypothetical protein
VNARVASTTASTVSAALRPAPRPFQHVVQAADAELLVAGPGRLHDAVGVEGQRVAGPQLHGPGHEAGVGEHAERHAAAVEALRAAVRAQQQRRVVAAVDVAEAAAAGLQAAEHRGHEAGLLARLEQQPVQRLHQGGPGGTPAQLAAQRRAEGRHDQRGRNALARHVRDDQAELPVGEGDEVEVVAADGPGRQLHRGEVVARDARGRGRQQALLHLVGHRELLLDPLLLEHLAVQQRLLDREGGGAGEELHELRVLRAEGPEPVALQVQGPEHLAVADDRHGQLRAGRGAADDVTRVARDVGGEHRLSGPDHGPDDALAEPQHAVVGARPAEADLGDARDQVGLGRAVPRHPLAQHEHAGGVVRDRGAQRLEQVVEHVLQVERSADPLRQLQQQPVLQLGQQRRRHRRVPTSRGSRTA